jgi:hypothetical protein
MNDAVAKGGCNLKRVADIGLSRGRRQFCTIQKSRPIGFTIAALICRVEVSRHLTIAVVGF